MPTDDEISAFVEHALAGRRKVASLFTRPKNQAEYRYTSLGRRLPVTLAHERYHAREDILSTYQTSSTSMYMNYGTSYGTMSEPSRSPIDPINHAPQRVDPIPDAAAERFPRDQRVESPATEIPERDAWEMLEI